MKTTLTSAALLAFVSTAAWAVTCLPIVNNDINVDGIVVAGTGGAVPAGCSAGGPDAAWGGVLGQEFKLAPGDPSTKKASLFMSAREAGGKISKIYFGVHVESAPDFTTNDKFTLYFQADGTKGDWDVANDFVLAFDGVGANAATPLNQDGCSSPLNQPLYYKRDAGNTTWVPQASFPAGITFKASFDYETAHDPEHEIWELEIGIDLSALNPALNIVKGAKVGIGGKLYLFETEVASTTPFYFPQTVAPSDPFLDFHANQGGVTPATLEKVGVGDCSFDVVIVSIQGSNDLGNAGTFTVLDPNSATDFNQATGAVIASRRSNFTATVKFVNPASLTDTNPVAVANSGKVDFRLRPYNAGSGSFTADIHLAQPPAPVSFNQLGESKQIPIKWPAKKSDWNGQLNVTDHACFMVDLMGFAVDDPNTGNHMQQNLAYVTTSTIKKSFLIAAPREVRAELKGPDGRIEYILRSHWDNLDPKFLAGSRPFRFRISNARALGLKSLGKGYYSMRLKPGEEKRVLLEITGGVMPHPVKQYKLTAKAGGQLLQPPSGDPPLEIPTKPGSAISIVTNGLITLARHAPNDANGYGDREQVERHFLLRRGFYRPEDYIGAVVASCDKFNTSFVVGTDSTFIVPERCDTLFLAVNNIAGQYDDGKGGFELSVMAGEPVALPTRLGARGSAANPKFGIPAQMQAGSILPQLVFDVGQRTAKPKQKIYRLIPTGYVAYAVYDSHPDRR
jgi:hypothetical protein